MDGIKFFFTGGATASNVEVLGTPIKNLGTNTVSFPNNGSHIWVEGAGTKVRMKGN